MGLLVRFYNSVNAVNNRFHDSRFLGHATHQDLHKKFNDISNQLDSNKLFQISMDGPDVNLKFYEAVVTERNENEQHQLINIGSCGLHAIDGVFQTGFKKSAWKIKKILKGFIMFFTTPQQREKITPQKLDLLNFHSIFVVLGIGV